VAVIFLRSTDGNNGNAGTQKEAPKATLAAALTAAGAGGVVHVSSIHAETQASAMTLTSPGTAASPVTVICVADWGAATGAGVPTTVATTGTITTTGNSNITLNGFCHAYGISIIAGSGSTGTASINCGTSSPFHWVLNSCVVRIATSGASSRLNINSSFTQGSHRLDLYDCTLSFGSTSQEFRNQGGRFCMHGGSVSETIPTTLISNASDLIPNEYVFSGVDLSALGSGKNIAGMSAAVRSWITLHNCKLNASVTLTTGSVANLGGTVCQVVNSDSADTNYRYYFQDYAGTITHETTIVRTGGASDGVTGFSRKFVSTANSKFYAPLIGPWFKFWSSTLSSITVAVEIVTDNVTLTDAEAWVEVLHPGTSGFPLGVFADDRAADILATPANQTSSSETWTTTGLTTPVKQALSKSVTPAEVGWVYARVVLAKASATVYACPKILSTSTYQYMEEDGSIINGPTVSAGGGLIGGGNLSGGFL